MLDALPGEKTPYSSWTEQARASPRCWRAAGAWRCSTRPMCAIPYVAMVDAGTVELVREHGRGGGEFGGPDPVLRSALDAGGSSKSHLEAGRRVDRVRRAAFELISERTRNGAAVQEYAVKQFVLERFREGGAGDRPDGPIVGVNANAAEPALRARRRKRRARSGAAISCCSTCGPSWTSPARSTTTSPGPASAATAPPEEMRRVFEIVREARDRGRGARAGCRGGGRAAARIRGGRRGARAHREPGLRRSTSRTARATRSAQEVHGNGREHGQSGDARRAARHPVDLLFRSSPASTCSDFGVRSEVNVFVGEREARVTGEMQKELLLL